MTAASFGPRLQSSLEIVGIGTNDAVGVADIVVGVAGAAVDVGSKLKGVRLGAAVDTAVGDAGAGTQVARVIVRETQRR